MDELFEALFGIIFILFLLGLFVEYVLPVLVVTACILGPAGAATLYTGKQLHKSIKEQYQLTWMSTSTLIIISFLTLYTVVNLLQETGSWQGMLSVIFIMPVALFLAWGTLWLWARSKTVDIRIEVNRLNRQYNKVKREIYRKEQEINRAKSTLEHKQQKYKEVLQQRSKHNDRVSEICRQSTDTRPVILARDTMITAATSMGIQELKQQIFLLRKTVSRRKGSLDEMKYHILSATLINMETGGVAQTLQQKTAVLQELKQRKQSLHAQRDTLRPTLQQAKSKLNGQRITLD